MANSEFFLTLSSRSRFSDDSFLVSIGASAGGLQALEAFFKSLSSAPDAAFVVARHLSFDFRSLMVEPLQLKLFATDVDPDARTIASQRIYPKAIADDIPPEQVEKNFIEAGASYRIKKTIRARVVFASHDLTKNPGFSQMHLVSCRSLLIYLQPALQERVLKLLHFSLMPQGVLLVGPPENLSAPISHTFHSLSRHWNLFHKRQAIQLPMSRVAHSPAVCSAASRRQESQLPSHESLLAALFHLRFGEHPTTCVLVSQSYQTLHVFLNTARLLDFPVGKISTNILEIILPTLKLPLSTALHRAIRNHKPVLYSDIQLPDLEPQQKVNLWVGRVESSQAESDPLLLILLEMLSVAESAEVTIDSEFDPISDLSLRVQELELELRQTRESLQTSIEELETANEELLVANKELQSTNEELQSVNEELYTVNSENQERIEQLIELGTDVDNVNDITQHKQREMQLQQVMQRLEQVQHMAHIGDWKYDVRQKAMDWSTEVFHIVEIEPETEIPSFSELIRLVHNEDRPLLIDAFNCSSSQNTAALDIRIYPQKSTTPKHVHITYQMCHNAAGELMALCGTVMDITERRSAQEALQHQAVFDSLTQLPNRAFFLQHLRLSMGRASRDSAYKFAVLYLDVDGFKEVNDTLGHAAGDQLLMTIAQRLDEVVRPGDIVSRLGGDEFAILLEKTTQIETALAIAFRIQTVVTEPISITASSISTTVSIGVAFNFPSDYMESETAILENADIAMYQAKRKGPGNVELFRPFMRAERVDQVELKVGLHRALEQDEFVLHYQPLVQIPSQSLMGFEALVRWHHPQRGLLSPMDFLPIVRASHLMPVLEAWILKKACQQVSHWSQQFNLSPGLQLNINISPDFLKHPTFIPKLCSALSEAAINPEQICLELTEESFIGYGNIVDTLLLDIKKLGVKIALDDFGTGYSSLSYLHRLPIDVVKIDQSFVQSLGTDSSLLGITQGIVGLTQQLELQVTAEGVETSEQLRLIQEFGCNYTQGYFFAHPIPAEEAGQLIANPIPLGNKFY
ncbi:MAG: EAL domain-containing protein [Leptolyngbyaceae cyanobacterium]